MLNFKKKLVAFYKKKLLRFRFYNKYTGKTKKILNFFNVFFLGFIKIILLKTFFNYQIELLIKKNFFIFKYLKFVVVKNKILKKKYFVNNFLGDGYARRRLLFKRFYFLTKLSRLGKNFLKLNIAKIKRRHQQLKSKKTKKHLYLVFNNYIKNNRVFIAEKKKPVLIKPFYKFFYNNFKINGNGRVNNRSILKLNIKKKKNLAIHFKKNIIKLKLKKKIREKRSLTNKKFKTIKYLRKLLLLKKKIFINRAVGRRFSFFFFNAGRRVIVKKKKKRFFHKKGNYTRRRVASPRALMRYYKKKTWKKKNIYLISFLKRKIRILYKNLNKKRFRKNLKNLLKKKKRFISSKKKKKPIKKKKNKKSYYRLRRRRRRLRRRRRFRSRLRWNFYNSHKKKKKLINKLIKKYYFIIGQQRRRGKNKKFYKTIFLKNLRLIKQEFFFKNKLNFVGYNSFLNKAGNDFFFRIKFLKFFNFNIRFLSVINKRFLKKNLLFFTKNKRKKKYLIEKLLGFNAKIYKLNNFDKFKFLKIIFQKNKKPFYIFDSSSLFHTKNDAIDGDNQKFFIKSTFNKFFHSFLNNAQLIKNQFSRVFFYDFFLRNLFDIKFVFKLIFDLKKNKFNFIHLLRNFIKPFLAINTFILKKKKNWIYKYFFKKSIGQKNNYYRNFRRSILVFKKKLRNKRKLKLFFLRKKRSLSFYIKKKNLHIKFKNIKKKNYLLKSRKKRFKFNKKRIISRLFFHKIFKVRKSPYLNNKLKKQKSHLAINRKLNLKKLSNHKYKKHRKVSIRVFFKNRKFFRKNFLYNLKVKKSLFRFFEHPNKLAYLFIKKLFLSTIKHGKKEKAFYLLHFCSKNLRIKFKNMSFISFMILIFKKLDCPITLKNAPLLKKGKVPREDYKNKIKLDNRRLKFPIKWIISSARDRREKNFALKLFNELLDIYLSKKCDTIRKLKEFNRIIFFNRRFSRNLRRRKQHWKHKNYQNFLKPKKNI